MSFIKSMLLYLPLKRVKSSLISLKILLSKIILPDLLRILSARPPVLSIINLDKDENDNTLASMTVL